MQKYMKYHRTKPTN